MFAYLRSHHKRGSQPNSPTSYPAPDFRPGNRADWINSPQPFSSDGGLSPVLKTNVSNPSASLLSRLNEHEEQNMFQSSYNIPNSDQEPVHDTIHQARSVAVIRFTSSMENIRPATSDHSQAAHTRSGSYTRPSTSYTRHETLPTARTNIDSTSDNYILRDKHAVDQKSSHNVANSQSTKTAKTRLNLLKPMSLLSRRRSGQPAEQTSEENPTCHKTLSVPAMKLPDNYDPSIRGKVVHDFSAPRPRRDYSSTSISAKSCEMKQETPLKSPKNSGNYDEISRPRNSERLHTPVFTEHFDDDDGKSREYQAAVQAECLADENFISRNMSSEQYTPLKPTFEVGMLRVAFPARIDSLKPRSGAALKLAEALEASSDSSPQHEETSEASNSEFEERIGSEKHNSSTDRTSSIPSRWASKASRFSFQTGGSDSAAQERLLEERHKQKSAAQGLTDAVKDMALLNENTDLDDMYADINYDGEYLEEQIPGVNAEFEDDELINGNLLSKGVAEMSLDMLQCTKESSNVALRTKAQEDIHIKSRTAGSPSTNLNLDSKWVPELSPNTEGLELNQPKAPVMDLASDKNVEANFSGPGDLIDDESLKPNSAENDDLYFDDGAIEYIDESADLSFNESMIDDFERPVKNSKLNIMDNGFDPNDQWNKSEQSSHGSPRSTALPPPRTTSLLVKTTSHNGPDPMIDAYHSALADAANKAVAEGKFDSRDNFNTIDDDREINQALVNGEFDGSNPSEFTSMIKQMTNEETSNIGLEMFNDITSYDEYPDQNYDYDRTADEDDIVAEANAEALANDDDGFYGQEFGFYAHAIGNAGEEEQAANGGFFGPRGFDDLCRSASGRNAVREPNLTPITERSEFSARNSYITLLNSGVSPVNIAASGNLAASFATAPSSATHSSPNLSLTHLVHPYGFEQDDMTMSQLLRLRRGAFGGSNSSLKSGDTSGSVSILDSVHSGPAAISSPLSAKAGTSSLSLSNSDSSVSPQVRPLYLDPQHQEMPGSAEIPAAPQMTTVDPTEQKGSLLHKSTHEVAPDSFAQYQSAEDPYYSYSDDNNAASESPTLTGINYPVISSNCNVSPPTLMTPIPGSIASSFALQPEPLPQRQQGPDISYSRLPSSNIPSITPSLESKDMFPQNYTPYPITVTTPVTTESTSRQQQDQQQPPSTKARSQTNPFANVHPQDPYHDDKSYDNTKKNNSNVSNKNSNDDVVDRATEKQFVRTHRRNASSTDNGISVGYVRERDSDGADRWVLERRRTAEDGAMELVGREVISQGWI